MFLIENVSDGKTCVEGCYRLHNMAVNSTQYLPYYTIHSVLCEEPLHQLQAERPSLTLRQKRCKKGTLLSSNLVPILLLTSEYILVFKAEETQPGLNLAMFTPRQVIAKNFSTFEFVHCPHVAI